MHQTAIVLTLLLFSPVVLQAQAAATVAVITGKAQLQKGEVWAPLAVGQKLVPGDTVSTGFRSELQLKVGPSVVTLKALSRLTLQALDQVGTTLQTDLYLKVGKVDAQVNKSDTVQSQKFKVGSPVATASVRGTSFSFDGVNLQVAQGLVDFSDQRGNTVSIPVGEAARVALGSRGIATNETLVVQDSVVSADTEVGDAWTDEATLEWDGWSYEDLLTLLYGYDWYSSEGGTYLSLNGIIPAELPLITSVTIGGISPKPLPSLTQITIGGIQP